MVHGANFLLGSAQLRTLLSSYKPTKAKQAARDVVKQAFLSENSGRRNGRQQHSRFF